MPRTCRRWLTAALAAALATALATVLTHANVDSSPDVVRFRGGKFGREFCSGVLIAPGVVLTTAHCAANAELATVALAGAQIAVHQTRAHPGFGLTHAFANNVALLFLHADISETHNSHSSNGSTAAHLQTSQRRTSRIAALPLRPTTTQGTADSGFHEIQVRSDSVALTPRADLSRRACASAAVFRDDASVWCSLASTSATGSSGSLATSLDCASPLETALGSPVVVQSRDSSSAAPTVVGLRLTESCDTVQAFVHVASVLDFLLPLLASPPTASTLVPPNHTIGFSASDPSATDATLGDLPATVTAGTSSPTSSASSVSLSSSPAPSSSPSPTPTVTWRAVSSASSSSSSSTGSSHAETDVGFPDLLHGSASSSGAVDVDVDVTFSSSAASSASDVAATSSFLGGWSTLPSLGTYSSFAALIVQNTTEARGELAGCIGVLIAPTFLIADGLCVGDLASPQVVVSTPVSNSSDASGPIANTLVLNVTRVEIFRENLGALALIELPHAIAGMTPIAISRSLSPEFHVTDASWELVSMDDLFASQRESEMAVSKQRVVRLPATSCSNSIFEAVPFTLCLALGAEQDRQDVLGFSQGFVLHDKKLVALPQCYSAICLGGLMHDVTFVAAQERWIRNQTQDTALWDTAPLALASINRDVVVEDGEVVTPAAATYAELLSSASTDAVAVCNGVLIAPSFVLTTASCVANTTVSHVRLGLDQRVSKSVVEDIMSVRRVYVHSAFKTPGARNANDLALLELGGMSFFLPALLASDDALQSTTQVPATSLVKGSYASTFGDSGAVQIDDLVIPAKSAATVRYSWALTASSADPSMLCGHAPPRNGSTVSGTEQIGSSTSTGSGSGSDASHDIVIACSQMQTLSGRTTDGAGLLAAFAEGNTVLGVTTSRWGTATAASATCPLASDACFARVATPSAREFIDSISVDHTWRIEWDKHRKGFEIQASKKVAGVDASNIAATQTDGVTVPSADDPGYTGSLHFDLMSADTQVGFVVGLRKDKSSQNFCGGSLIAPSYVLTAAHCVVSGDVRFVSVGSHESAGTTSELIAVKKNKVIIHPLYGKQSGISYDVAIIELEAQAYPQPIVLDNALGFDATTQFTLYGYGANSARSVSLSPVLRSVELPLYDRASCQKFFPELDASMLCAGGQLARDACTGDSGSPLVYYDNGVPVLVGVVSTGRNGCGTPGVPGIYGSVANIQTFINSYVAGYSWLDASKFVGPLLTAPAAPSSAQASSSPATSTAGLRTSLSDSAPFEIIHSATGEDQHQLSIVKLASDTPGLLQDAIMEYLLGGYAMAGGAWERKSREIKDAATSITFYSSGDMTSLMVTIAAHRAKPLYERSARFGKRRDASKLLSACCTAA